MKENILSDGSLASLIGTELMVFCFSYIYVGTLIKVENECIVLDAAKIIYETGAFSDKGYLDAQALPGGKVYLMKTCVESFCLGK